MNRGTILLRVDGSASEGMGRVARSLALANALQRRRYQMAFLSRIDNNAWPDRIRRHRHLVVRTNFASGSDLDKAELLREIETRRPVVLVTDSACYDEEYLAQLSHRVPLVISIDERCDVRFPSDIVLNPTLGHTSRDYATYPGTQILAGDKYAMVRAEFRRARSIRSTEPGGPRRVLVSLGAGDVGLPTARIARALLCEKGIDKVDALIGADTSVGREEIRKLSEEFAGRFHVATDARDLGLRITKSHLLVTGGGNTTVEAACVGIPMVVLTLHERNRLHAERLEDIGVVQYLGGVNDVKPDRVAKAAIEILSDDFERKAMSRAGRMLIDGRGADRLVTATEILLRRSRRTKPLAAAA